MPCPRQLPIPWIPREGSLKPSLLSPHPRVRLLEKGRENLFPFQTTQVQKGAGKQLPLPSASILTALQGKKVRSSRMAGKTYWGDPAYPKHSLPHSRFITTSNRLSFPPSELDEFSIWDVFLVPGTVLSPLPTCVGSCSALPDPDNYFSGCLGASGRVVGSAQIDPSQSNAWNKLWINP